MTFLDTFFLGALRVIFTSTILYFLAAKKPKPDDRLDTLKEESMDTAEPIPGSSQQATAGSPGQQATAGSPGKKRPSELPFQLQVVYTDTEGAKAMRLLTKTKPITTDRFQAERGIDP